MQSRVLTRACDPGRVLTLSASRTLVLAMVAVLLCSGSLGCVRLDEAYFYDRAMDLRDCTTFHVGIGAFPANVNVEVSVVSVGLGATGGADCWTDGQGWVGRNRGHIRFSNFTPIIGPGTQYRDNRKPGWNTDRYGGIGFHAGVIGCVTGEVELIEVLDLIVGLFGLDLCGDDTATQVLARAHRVPATRPAETSPSQDVRDLHYAVKWAHLGHVQRLLVKGVSIDAKDWDGRTALHLGAAGAHPDIVACLLVCGAAPRLKDGRGLTPLHRVAYGTADRNTSGWFRQMDTLRLRRQCRLRAGREKHDAWGRLPQMATLSHDSCRVDMAKLILAHRAPVDARDNLGLTPLHRAAWRGRAGLVGLFLDAGADVNARDHVGQTPLHLAALACNRDVVELLLAKGADVNAKTRAGRTPLDLAAGVTDYLSTWVSSHASDVMPVEEPEQEQLEEAWRFEPRHLRTRDSRASFAQELHAELSDRREHGQPVDARFTRAIEQEPQRTIRLLSRPTGSVSRSAAAPSTTAGHP